MANPFLESRAEEKSSGSKNPFIRDDSASVPEAPSEPGFIDRLKQDFSKRKDMVGEALSEDVKAKSYPPFIAMDVMGKGVGGMAMDVAGEGIKSVANAVPDSVKKAGKSAGAYLGDTDAAVYALDAVRGGGDAYSKFAKQNPNLARHAESFVDATGGAAALKGMEPVAKLGLKTAGKTLGGMREAVNAKSDAMAIGAPPEHPSLTKGAGGEKLTVSPKAMTSGRSILHTALKEDGINPLDVAQKLEQAKATGLPITAVDVINKDVGGVQTHGKNTIGLLKGAANMPGPGAAMAGEVAARGRAAVKRLGTLLDTALSDKGKYEVSDAALEKMKTETPVAYKAAFEGGSIAPLEKQFEGEFAQAAQQITAARQKLNAAQQKITQIEAKKQTNSNVYVDNSLISAKRAAHEELQAAQKELSKASAHEDSVKKILRQAQSDAKNGVKGAVWSPRIQEMLGDDTVQAGIKKGLWIAKKEALANGEKFNPHEYGITGYDASGEPIVSKVPNMRMLDAGKKGLDAIINESKNPLTGKMNETGRAVSMLKNSYLKEIDAINPDYAKARQNYGSHASQLEALRDGENFMRMDKEEIARFMKDPNTSHAEKAAFASGVKRHLQNMLDKADKGASSTNPINQIWTKYMADKLEPIFPNKQVFEKFSNIMEHERTMAHINNQLATGSHTNMLGNFQKKASAPGKIYKAIRHPTGAVEDAVMGMVNNKLSKEAANMSKDEAAIISRYLTTDDPQVWYDLATKMEQ